MAEEKYKVANDFKVTVELLSGQTVVIDLMKVSTQEWKTVLKPGTTDDEEYRIVSKSTGLKPEELSAMEWPNYRILVDAFIKAGAQPLTNPT